MRWDEITDFDAFDSEYEDWIQMLDNLNEEEDLEYAIGKHPAQCEDCGEWHRAKDLIDGTVCEDCAYRER